MRARASTGSVLNLHTLWRWASEARDEARSRAMAASASALWSWRSFVDEQLRSGAGVLHSFTKRQPVPAGIPVVHACSSTLSRQRLVGEDCRAWLKVWLKFEATATAP